MKCCWNNKRSSISLPWQQQLYCLTSNQLLYNMLPEYEGWKWSKFISKSRALQFSFMRSCLSFGSRYYAISELIISFKHCCFFSRCDTIHLSCRLPSTPVGQVAVKSVLLQKAAGPVEAEQAVRTSTEMQIPVVDSYGERTNVFDHNSLQ